MYKEQRCTVVIRELVLDRLGSSLLTNKCLSCLSALEQDFCSEINENTINVLHIKR